MPQRVSTPLARTAARRRDGHDGDFLFRAVLQDDAELVAGGAADHVGAAQGAGQPVAHAHDHFLAGIEAEAVIDHGQPVDGGDQEGAGAVLGLGALDGAGQFLAQRVAVQMAGQFVARRQIGQAAHLAEAFGDVAHQADDAHGACPLRRACGCRPWYRRPRPWRRRSRNRPGRCRTACRAGSACRSRPRRRSAVMPSRKASARGHVQMLRQDVGGAVPADLAGGDVPVERGGAGGLDGKAQAQFVLQLHPAGRRPSCSGYPRVQHNPPSPGQFLRPCRRSMAPRDLRKRKSLGFCRKRPRPCLVAGHAGDRTL